MKVDQADSAPQDELNRLRKENARLKELVRINRQLHSSLDVDKVLQTIVEVATRMLEAERSTLYVIDEKRNEIWSRIAQGESVGEIRLKIGQGIAGFVAATGQTVRIKDAHKDKRFNPEVDARTGFRTRSVLCMPLELRDGKRIGVIQVMNKQGGEFAQEDEEYLRALCLQAAISLQNAQYTARQAALSRQNRNLVQLLEQRLHDLQELKMLSMKNMARGIAHEVNNALAKIKGGAEALQTNINDLKQELAELVGDSLSDNEELTYLLDEGLDSCLQGILEGSSGIEEIVRRIKNFVRLDQEPFQETDLNQDIQNVIKLSELEIRESGVLLKTKLGDIPPVQCRPREINMVLRELLRNAIYYASEGKKPDEPKLVLITTATCDAGRTVQTSFLDNGPGIPEQAGDQIFDLFFTTKPEGSGFGLGLSECYAIATRNGGTLNVETLSADESAKYSTKITLRLPSKAT